MKAELCLGLWRWTGTGIRKKGSTILQLRDLSVIKHASSLLHLAWPSSCELSSKTWHGHWDGYKVHMWLQFSGFKGLESTSLGRTIKGTSTFSHIHSSYISKFSTNASWPAIRASYTFLSHAEVETFVAASFAAFATFFPPGGCKATQYIVKSLYGGFLMRKCFSNYRLVRNSFI